MGGNRVVAAFLFAPFRRVAKEVMAETKTKTTTSSARGSKCRVAGSPPTRYWDTSGFHTLRNPKPS